MAFCESCGVACSESLRVRMGGRIYTYDSYVCALKATAPRCPGCNDFLLCVADGAELRCEVCDGTVVAASKPSKGHSSYAIPRAAWEQFGLTFGLS